MYLLYMYIYTICIYKHILYIHIYSTYPLRTAKAETSWEK